jgi:hypothetical protein
MVEELQDLADKRSILASSVRPFGFAALKGLTALAFNLVHCAQLLRQPHVKASV